MSTLPCEARGREERLLAAILTGECTPDITPRDRKEMLLKAIYEQGTLGISVLNKNGEAINATLSTVQTVSTQYVVTNYRRQPKDKDALIITLTDQSNDKVLFVYSETSAAWTNIGIDIDLTQYYTKTESNTLLAAKVDKQQLVADAGKVLGIGADGMVAPVAGGGITTVTDTTSTTAALAMAANTKYVFTQPLTALTLSSVTDNSFLLFTAAAGIYVSVPSTVVWAVADPIFTAGKTYSIKFYTVGSTIIGEWVAA